MSLSFQTVKGTAWLYAAFLNGRILGLVTTAVLARVLGPNEFGLFAFALLILGIAEVLRDLGFKEALIFAPDQVEQSANATFLISSAFGFFQFLLVYLLAPLAEGFINDSRIVSVLQILAFSFVFNGFAQVQDGLLRKAMNFRSVAVAEMCALTLKAVIAIAMAFYGFGLWSLVYAHLLSTAIRTTLLWYLSAWRPGRAYSYRNIGRMWGFGIHIVLQRVLSELSERFDQLMIIVYFSEGLLGVYYIAGRIPELVTSGFSEVLTKVLYPAFASVNQDRESLNRAFLNATKFTALITVPTGIGIAAIAPELIPFVFGSGWGGSIPLAQILALVGLVSTLPWCTGDVLTAIGRPQINTILMALETLAILVLLWFAARTAEEITTIAWTLLAVVSFSALSRMFVATRILGIDTIDYVRVLRSPFIAGGIMAAIVQALGLISAGSGAALLMSQIAIGVLSYIAVLYLVDRKVLFEAADILRTLVRSSPPDSWRSVHRH